MNTVFVLTDGDFEIYQNTNISYVFHELLSYKFNLNKNLFIREKVNDVSKRFPLYLDTIRYADDKQIFISEKGMQYQLPDFCKQIIGVKETTIIPIKTHEIVKKINNIPKMKIIKFNKTVKNKPSEVISINSDKQNEEKIDKVEDKDIDGDTEEVDEQKLRELKELIEKMEEMKEEEEIKKEEIEEELEKKVSEERAIKMKDRSINDKKKELKNIFEADRRLFFNFYEIIMEIKKLKEMKENNIHDTRKRIDLSVNEFKARVLFDNGKEFEIPVMFMHKYPIFNFMKEFNFIEHEHAFLIWKKIYYKNYEINTESRKYFGNSVYMLNNEEQELFNKLSTEEIEIIEAFNKTLEKRIIDVEKIIQSKFNESQNKKIFENNPDGRHKYQKIEQSDSEYSDSEESNYEDSEDYSSESDEESNSEKSVNN